MDLAVDTARFIPLRTPLLKLFPIACPDDVALLTPLLSALLSELMADFAFDPTASNPAFTTSTDFLMLLSELFADFALLAIDFILEFTAFNATAIAAVPAAPVTIAAPNTSIPADTAYWKLCRL